MRIRILTATFMLAATCGVVTTSATAAEDASPPLPTQVSLPDNVEAAAPEADVKCRRAAPIGSRLKRTICVRAMPGVNVSDEVRAMQMDMSAPPALMGGG